MADTKDDAGKAFDLFCAKYHIKYEKAVACLEKDRDALKIQTATPLAMRRSESQPGKSSGQFRRRSIPHGM
jgi:hypothetical protein